MLCGAAEERGDDLIGGRGDAFCGMLNASYNCNLRQLAPYIPEYPIGTAPEVAGMIRDFLPIARVMLGLKGLKIFSFGPRPHDFLACNAPIKPLYDLGVEIMENSELDLYDIFRAAADKATEIERIAQEMASELGQDNTYPEMLRNLAQFEAGLLDFMGRNLGASRYGVFANKCWPSFEKYFGFTPCYVNSRLASKGMPVACEVDIYGALSQYMATLASDAPATLLDINNTVPRDMAQDCPGGYKPTDLFMGFHCGNTPACHVLKPALKFQLIMHRLMEPGKEPDITRGTLEGRIKPGDITLFRLQSSADAVLRSYCAQGEILDMDPRSFGGIGVFAVREMGRFYRHVLIGKHYPHHAAVAFKHAGKALYAAAKLLGVGDVAYNQPLGIPYPNENPFG
jgi:L-fucose isomerase-like protein